MLIYRVWFINEKYISKMCTIDIMQKINIYRFGINTCNNLYLNAILYISNASMYSLPIVQIIIHFFKTSMKNIRENKSKSESNWFVKIRNQKEKLWNQKIIDLWKFSTSALGWITTLWIHYLNDFCLWLLNRGLCFAIHCLMHTI